jgi:hypothetical protein
VTVSLLTKTSAKATYSSTGPEDDDEFLDTKSKWLLEETELSDSLDERIDIHCATEFRLHTLTLIAFGTTSNTSSILWHGAY